MLIILFQWIIICILAYLAILLALQALGSAGHRTSFTANALPVRLLLGMALLGSWAVLISLFIPLSWLALLLTCLLLSGGAWIYRRSLLESLREDWNRLKRTHPLILFSGMALVVICLFWSAQVPENYDTGLYHAQAIRWLEEYGTVTGLGNLIAQLGYNSLLFPLAALSSFSFLEFTTSHAINGLLFAVFGSFLLGRIAGLFMGRINVGIVSSVSLIYLSRRIYIRELSSPSTDLPAAIFTWLVILLFVDDLQSGDEDRSVLQIASIVLASIFAIMFKLSTLPVILIPLYLLIRNSRKQGFGRLILLSLAILIPWEARGLLLSGLPLYPSKVLDFIDLKWEIPQISVDNQLFWMRYYGRNESQDPATNYAMAFSQWFPVWWQRLGIIDQILVMGALATAIGLLVYGIAMLVNKQSRQNKPGMQALASTLLLLILFWFIGSPLIRYGYPVVIILFSIGLASVCVWLIKARITWLPYLTYAVTCVILVYQLYGVYKITRSELLEQALVRPADYPESELTARSLGDFDVYMPVGEYNYDWCWYAPLPCTPVHDPWVNLLGTGLGDGFYNSAP